MCTESGLRPSKGHYGGEIDTIRASSQINDWLVISDFNEIRHPAEREGQGSFDRVGAGEFESVINGFTELQAVGGDFTWSNGEGLEHTRSKLDRALENASWIARWPQVRPRLIRGTTSDHAGLLINLTRVGKSTTPFKFYNSWLCDEKFNVEFKRAWATPVEGSPLYCLQQKINEVRRAGEKWTQRMRENNRTSRVIAAELHCEAMRLQSDPSNQTIQGSCRNLRTELIESQHREYLDIQQRAHISWIT